MNLPRGRLSGGEPLIRKDVVALVTHGHEVGLYTTLLTSGLGFSLARALRLKEAGFDHVQIRFRDVDSEAAERMAGGWSAAQTGGRTSPELVAAVSEAGGLGSLAATGLSPSRLREAIRTIAARSDRPFAVNVVLARPEPPQQDIAVVQRFLDRFRERLGLPPGRSELSVPPSPLPEQLEVIFDARAQGEVT